MPHTAAAQASARAALAKGSIYWQNSTNSAAAGGAAASTPASSTLAAGGAEGFWTLSDVNSRPEEFRKALSRGILAHNCVELRAVLMVDAPANAQDMMVRLQTPQHSMLCYWSLSCGHGCSTAVATTCIIHAASDNIPCQTCHCGASRTA